jgi:hypothetical protein
MPASDRRILPANEDEDEDEDEVGDDDDDGGGDGDGSDGLRPCSREPPDRAVGFVPCASSERGGPGCRSFRLCMDDDGFRIAGWDMSPDMDCTDASPGGAPRSLWVPFRRAPLPSRASADERWSLEAAPCGLDWRVRSELYLRERESE